MITRKQIAKAFRNAVPYLGKEDDTRLDIFICHAIESGNSQGHACRMAIDPIGRAARKIIQDRIAPCFTLNDWLRTTHGISGWHAGPNAMQEYRHAWLQELIKEFETKE